MNPRSPGHLRIGELQLPSGDSWSKISGQTFYTNKNPVLRDLVLSDQEQIRFLSVDASRIDTKTLGLKLDCAIGGGQLSASAGLIETASSLNAKINVAAQKIAAESLNKFLLLPEDSLSGEIARLWLRKERLEPSICHAPGAERCRCRSAMWIGQRFISIAALLKFRQNRAERPCGQRTSSRTRTSFIFTGNGVAFGHRRFRPNSDDSGNCGDCARSSTVNERISCPIDWLGSIHGQDRHRQCERKRNSSG